MLPAQCSAGHGVKVNLPSLAPSVEALVFHISSFRLQTEAEIGAPTLGT